jgi:hypothetical protein
VRDFIWPLLTSCLAFYLPNILSYILTFARAHILKLCFRHFIWHSLSLSGIVSPRSRLAGGKVGKREGNSGNTKLSLPSQCSMHGLEIFPEHLEFSRWRVDTRSSEHVRTRGGSWAVGDCWFRIRKRIPTYAGDTGRRRTSMIIYVVRGSNFILLNSKVFFVGSKMKRLLIWR